MSIRKVKAGTWLVTVEYGLKWDGSRDRRTKTAHSEREAKRYEAAMLVEAGKGGNGGITFSDFVELVYWPAKAALRENTRASYESVIRTHLEPAFGNLDISAVNRLAIQAMLKRCSSRKAATNARETLSSILALAVELDLIAVNPAGFKYDYPPAREVPADHYGIVLGTFAEHRRILEDIASKQPGSLAERMCVLGLCFGLRKGEVFGLDWDCVDLRGGVIEIRQTYTYANGHASLTPPKTPKAHRFIPIPAYARERLADWEQDGESVVCDRCKRMMPWKGSKYIARLVGRGAFDDGEAYPRITLNSMRHSFGTACIDAGIEVSRVSAWMGHRDVTTTYNRYVRPSIRQLAGDATAIDAAFGL